VQLKFSFTVECASSTSADVDRVESMIDLHMQDLVYDEEFISALNEQEAVTIQVKRIDQTGAHT
jgi:hypothetical protein